MELEGHNVLVVGVGLPETDSTRAHVQVIRAPTTRLATDHMKKHHFDLVIVHANLTNEDNMTWIKRLRAARPFLPLAVVHDASTVPQAVEVSLRLAGVTAVLCSKTKELQAWLTEWLARREANNARDHGLNP